MNQTQNKLKTVKNHVEAKITTIYENIVKKQIILSNDQDRKAM